jgi:hypothetical protein
LKNEASDFATNCQSCQIKEWLPVLVFPNRPFPGDIAAMMLHFATFEHHESLMGHAIMSFASV